MISIIGLKVRFSAKPFLKVAVAALLALSPVLSFGQEAASAQKAPRGAQTLLPPSHWIYDSLQILEQECGIVQFSDQAPLSVQQIRAMLSEIDYDDLSAAGRAHYDNIIEYFNETKFSAQYSILQLRAEPAANLEGYVKTNDDVPWVYDRFEKRHFLELPVTIGLGDYASFYTDIFAGLSKSAMTKSDTYVNVPHSEPTFDVNFPHNAYASFGTMFGTADVGLNFRVSNMGQSFGRAETGSIIQSEYLTDATNAALTVFSPIFQYSAAITEFNTDRYMYAHKLDARFGKKLQVSAMEACLPYGSMDLRFFNPLMILHNYTAWLDYQEKDSDVGSYLALKVNYAPAKRIRIFALWSMTQFQLPTELDDDDTDDDNYVPNAMGWQGGVESYIPLGAGHLHFNLEGYYAQPYLYINSSPNWSFVRTSGESNGSKDFYEWIGTKYGPDTVAASFSASYEVPKRWTAAFKYVFLARGELSNPDIFRKVGWGPRILNVGAAYNNGVNQYLKENWVYPVHDGNLAYRNGRNSVAPSGDTVEYANIITVCGSYCLTDWLKVMMQPSLAFVTNSGNISGDNDVSFECVLSFQCEFTRMNRRR